METTISKLNKQIEQRLKGINDYESIHINSSLGIYLIHILFLKKLSLLASLLTLQ